MCSSYILPLLLMLILPTNLTADIVSKPTEELLLLAANKEKKRTVKKSKRNKKPRKNAAGLLVSVNYFGFGLGASYNYNLIKKLDIGSNFLYSNANLKGDIDGLTEKYDFSTLSLSIGARYFVFMNFYAGINVAYSSANGEYGFSGENLDKSQTIAPFSSSLIHTDFLIGTKWRVFKRFYVGADWVGYGLVLSSSSSSDANDNYSTIIEGLAGEKPEVRIDNELASQLQPFYLVLSSGVYF